MPDDAVWYVGIEGAQLGPLTNAQVTEKIRSGEISATAYVQGPGYAEWTPISQVTGFAPYLGGFGAEPAGGGGQDLDWHVLQNGAEQGPLTNDQVTAKIRAGEITAQAQVKGPGSSDWTPIMQVMNFAPILSGFGTPSADDPAVAALPRGEAEPWMQYEGWLPAYRGLSLYYKAIGLAILLVILMVAAPLLLIFFGGAMRMGGSVSWMAWLFGVGIPLGWLGVAVMMLIGLFLYARVPPESGGRGMAQAALVLCAIAMALTGYLVIKGILDGSSGAAAAGGGGRGAAKQAGNPFMNLLATATAAFGFVALMISMIKVARFIDQETVALKVRSTLILWIATFLGQVVVGVITAGLGRVKPGTFMVFLYISAGLAVLALVCLVLFMGAVNGMRTALMVAET
jgi:hypothetical protein